MVIGIGG
jgi:hypothetical protein